MGKSSTGKIWIYPRLFATAWVHALFLMGLEMKLSSQTIGVDKKGDGSRMRPLDDRLLEPDLSLIEEPKGS